jgi:uncharacterized protein YndB with AHSA1/START domain
MSRQSLLLENVARKVSRTRRRGRAAQWSMGTSICVHADVRRIFQMLTVAEYLETWMCLPSEDAKSYVSASRSENEYRLDFYTDRRLNASVIGSYLVCRHRKVVFSWRNMEAASGVSIVDIRLRGNFGSTIVELHHAGLTTAAEYFGQMAMWRASLERLVRLMTNSRPRADAKAARSR